MIYLIACNKMNYCKIGYSSKKEFYNNKEFKKELQNVTTSNVQTIIKDIKVLESKELIYRIDNSYKIHPKYAFRCSLKERERELRMIENMN